MKIGTALASWMALAVEDRKNCANPARCAQMEVDRHVLSLRVLLTALLLIWSEQALGQGSGEWSSAPAMPTARSAVAAIEIDGKIYVVGGRDGRGRALGILERFDVRRGDWETLKPMPTARFDAAAVAYRGQLVVIGGRGTRGEGMNARHVLDVVELYDPDSDSWRSLPALVEEREGHIAFVLSDTMFVAGGSDQSQSILGSVEYLTMAGVDGERSEWQTSSMLRLDVPRAAMAVAVSRGRAFAFGGFTPVPVNFVQEFRNSRLQIMLPPGAFRSRGAHAAVAVGDTIVVLGGRGPGGGESLPLNPVLSDVDYYLTTTGEWSTGPSMRTARESFAAVSVGSTLYVIGGRGENDEALKSVETLRLSTGTDAEKPFAPADFYLKQNSPNPFSDRTFIEFSVSASSRAPVSIDVFDLQGRVVKRLAAGFLPPGPRRVAWDGRSESGDPLASGVYLYRLSQGPHRAYQKLILIQ